jgi:hypothetical protein
MPMQFKTIEKIKKVSFSGREILESLVVISGIYFVLFYENLRFFLRKIMPFKPQK